MKGLDNSCSHGFPQMTGFAIRKHIHASERAQYTSCLINCTGICHCKKIDYVQYETKTYTYRE